MGGLDSVVAKNRLNKGVGVLTRESNGQMSEYTRTIGLTTRVNIKSYVSVSPRVKRV